MPLFLTGKKGAEKSTSPGQFGLGDFIERNKKAYQLGINVSVFPAIEDRKR